MREQLAQIRLVWAGDVDTGAASLPQQRETQRDTKEKARTGWGAG
jgi:hypothetical protein